MESLDKLKKIKEQFEFLEAKLASGVSDNFANISREYAELKPVVETIKSYLMLLDELLEVFMVRALGHSKEGQLF